jgi:hypothetical protein
LAAAASANAATYYVRNGGSDSADGRSHETAWATVQKVNSHSFSAGDSVLFQEGGIWKGQTLTVDWGGTTTTRAVVGAYYVANGTAQRGYKTKRPTIDGNHQVPSNSEYNGLVQVLRDRVRVENLIIMNSEGRGVNIAEVDFAEIVGNRIDNTFNCGISVIKGEQPLIQGNHVTESDRQRPEKGENWCAAIAVVQSNAPTVRGNTVEKVHGEGINLNHNTTDGVVEDNFVFSARAVGIYADVAPRATIRRNIVVGSTNSVFWRSAGTVGAGIAVNNENYHYSDYGGSLAQTTQSRGVRIYGNLVAFTDHGIGFWGALPSTTFDNTMIFNNTLVDNDVQFVSRGDPMPGSMFVNNILLSVGSNTKDIEGAPSGLTARNNYFSQGDAGSIYTHAGNRYNGLQIARMSDWRKISEITQVSWQDFTPAGISSTNGAGDGTLVSLASSKDSYSLDYKSQPHNNPPDMGAIRSGPAGKTPRGPGSVEATAGR